VNTRSKDAATRSETVNTRLKDAATRSEVADQRLKVRNRLPEAIRVHRKSRARYESVHITRAGTRIWHEKPRSGGDEHARAYRSTRFHK
jgi:hypothetical protein